MKRIIFYFTVFLTICSQAQKPVSAKLQKATVYLQGAHLYYSENVNLVQGNNELVFENISPYITDASLQASCKGGVVMEVRHILKYKEKVIVAKQYDKEIENVLDSMEELGYQLKDIDNKVKVLATEKNMLLNNRIIKGEPLRDSLALLRDGMQFLQDKLNSIYEQELKLQRSKDKLDKMKNKLNERYNMLTLLQSGQDNSNAASAQPIHEVLITLFADNVVNTQVNFNYFIATANWVPQYDLQASSASNNFQLRYFANVTQNSGIDWMGVPLTLSTSNPNESNTKPELNPWYLGFVNYRTRANQGALSNTAIPQMPKTVTDSKKEKIDDEYKTLEKYVQVTENIIRTEYEISLKYNIAADGKMHKVLISQKDVPMLLEFAAVPKVCTDAFLLAKVTGWEDMNIIPGKARLYFDGAYVGEIYLDASTTSDTLSINLGRDKSIAITRKKIKENFKDKVIAEDKIETRTIEIVVHNTKNIPIEIVLEDQIPVVTGTNEIKVTLVKADGADVEESSGKLSWHVKLGVKDSKKILFTYEIRHPKGREIAGL